MRARPSLIVLTLILAARSAPVQAQSPSDDPRVDQALGLLETWADAQLAYERLPGLSMAVVHDQALIWSRGFGHAHPDRGARATPETMYSICSISKLFTSIAVLQLRDRGMLRLRDPLREHIPEFDIRQTAEETTPITVRSLLTHSSGLPREGALPYWTEVSFPERSAILERLSSQETLYPVDRYYQYSNLGLTLAGELVSAVAGEPYTGYVRRNVLEPLGLGDTYPDHPEQHRGARLATGYSRPMRDGSRQRIGPYTLDGIAPAAGFTSTVEDLGRFASWQFRLLDEGGEEVLKATTLREMHRVHWVDPDWEATRGLGFSVWREDETTFVGHGGYCPGYQSHLRLQPDAKVATVFMTNANGVSSGLYTRRAHEIVAPAIAAALDDPEGAPEPDPAVERYVGRYDELYGEWHVIPWKEGLALVTMPTENPLGSLIELRHEKDHTFRRIRDDGTPGETVRFEVDADGVVQRAWRHGRYADRVR